MAKPQGKGCRDPSSATRFLPDLEEELLCSLSFLSFPAGKTPPAPSRRQGWVQQEAVKSSRPIARRAQPLDKLLPRPPDLHYFLLVFFFLETAARSSVWVVARMRECAGTELLCQNSAR